MQHRERRRTFPFTVKLLRSEGVQVYESRYFASTGSIPIGTWLSDRRGM